MLRGPGRVAIVCCGWTFMSLGSCGEGKVRPGVTVTDSAGIEIVQHSLGAQVPSWALNDEPDVRIGVVEGNPQYQFDNIVDAVRDEDGRIVVLDRSWNRVSVFGPDGAFISASGREGEGPGEYKYPSAMWRIPGDSLAVYDPRLGRVSVLDRDAHWMRSVRVPPISTLVLPNGAFENGHLLVIDPFPDLREYGWAVSYTVSTQGIDSIGRFRHIENMEPGPFGSVPQPLVSQMRYMSAGGKWLYVVRNSDYELEVHDSNGALRRIVRWHGRDLTATPAAIERYKENVLENIPDDRRAATRKALDDEIPNEKFPAFGRLLADRHGNAWLRTSRHPFDTGPAEWTVVSPLGQRVGRLEMPEGVTLLEAAAEYVLLLLTDHLGVQSVALYDLDRDPKN